MRRWCLWAASCVCSNQLSCRLAISPPSLPTRPACKAAARAPRQHSHLFRPAPALQHRTRREGPQRWRGRPRGCALSRQYARTGRHLGRPAGAAGTCPGSEGGRREGGAPECWGGGGGHCGRVGRLTAGWSFREVRRHGKEPVCLNLPDMAHRQRTAMPEGSPAAAQSGPPGSGATRQTAARTAWGR